MKAYTIVLIKMHVAQFSLLNDLCLALNNDAEPTWTNTKMTRP